MRVKVQRYHGGRKSEIAGGNIPFLWRCCGAPRQTKQRHRPLQTETIANTSFNLIALNKAAWAHARPQPGKQRDRIPPYQPVHPPIRILSAPPLALTFQPQPEIPRLQTRPSPLQD